VADNDAIIRILRGNRWSEAHFDDRGNVYETRPETAPERNERIKALAIQANAAAAMTQAQAEADRVRYEAQAAGLAPSGSSAPQLIPPTVGAGGVPTPVPMDIQAEELDRQRKRIDSHVDPGDLLLDWSGKGYLDQPSGTDLVTRLRLANPNAINDIVYGRTLNTGLSNLFVRPLVAQMERQQYEADLPKVLQSAMIPDPAYGFFGYGPETPSSRLLRLNWLLHRHAADLYPRR
jgi:hypothetical protein